MKVFCGKSFARYLVPAFVVVGLALGSVFAAELVGTTKKMQRNAAAMGGKRSLGATKAIQAMSGQGTMSMSAGTSKKVRRGHQAIRCYPATILNLGARTGVLHGEASLTWTAPGADGMAGRASGYRIAYSTAGPITSETGFDAAAVYAQSFVPLAAGAAESRTLSGLPYGATVYFAVKGIEPAGNRGYVSNSTAAYVLAPASITGTVAYSGTQAGKIVVAVFDSTRIFTTANLLVSTQLARAGGYGVTGIPPGTTFYAAGFVDVNQSLQFESGEDYGFYGGASPVSFNLTSGGSAAGIDFSVLVASTAHLGTISGNISYAGAQSGSLRIEVFNNQAFSGQPVAAIYASPGAYSFSVPGEVAYFMRAFMDQNSNTVFDTGEAAGFYGPLNQGAESIFVARQGTASGKNIAVYDPGCAAAGCSGLGTSTVSPSVMTAGSLADFNIKLIVGPSGMQSGGLAGFGVAPGWGALQNTCPSCNGYVALAWTSASTATVALDGNPSTGGLESLAGQFSAAAKITAGSLNPGDTVQFTISQFAAPCQARVSAFPVTASQNANVAALPLASGSPSILVQAGGAVTMSFSPLSLTLTQYTTSQALLLSGKDLCGVAASVSNSTDVVVSGRVYNFSTGLFDSTADLRLATSPVDGFFTPHTVTFAAGQSSATLFATAFSTGSKHIQAAYNLGGVTRYAYSAVNVLQGDPFSNVNLSSGAFTTSRVSMTITPDGDGAGDTAFVNFNLAEPFLAWKVQISSVSFDAGGTALWQSQGSGSALQARTVWDGRINLGSEAGRTAAAGVYYVRLTAGGAVNDTLQITVVVNQVSGQVTDPGITPAVPLPDVRVQAFGPVAGQVFTDSSGRYLMSGVAVGTYTFTFSKGQYLSVSTRTVVAGAATTLNVALARAPILEVIPTLQAGATQPYEQWGELLVYTAGWTKNFLQPVRLPAGTTTFDDGGQWNSSLQQFVTRTRFRFEVTLDTYTVEAQLAGYFPVSSAAYVGAAGLDLAMPQLNRRVNLSGLVSLSTATNPVPNPSGLTVSVLALSSGSAKGSTLISLPAGTTSAMYLITGMEPGSYTLRASAPGFESVSSGPVTVGALDVAGLNLPSFREGGVLSGAVTVNGDTSGFAPLAGSTYPIAIGITAWSQATAAQSRTTVYLSSAAATASAPYVITGLKPGATYQLFADISFSADAAFQSAGGFPKTVFISTQTQAAALNFSFEKASGAVAGLMRLSNPVDEIGAPAPDFTQATLKWRILRSDDPLRVGRVFEARISTGLPGFLCGGVSASTGTAPGCAAGVSSATFRLSGFRTETLELAMFYAPTGRSKVVTVAAVNGSTVTTTLDLRGETYSISGKILNQISDPLFNTNALIGQNAPFYAPDGYPAGVSSTTARVEAIRREFGELQTQVSTSAFDAARTRIGFLDSAGTYAITGIQNGVYLLRTLPLRATATGPVLVPGKEQVVTIANAARTGVDFTLSDGFSVSGRVSLDQGLSDARNLRLALKNRRGEVVESLDLLLGNPGAGIAASSVDYLFERVPSAGFYTLEAADLGAPVKYIARPLSFPDRTTSPDGLQGDVSGMELLLKRAGAITGKLRDANSDSLITEMNATLLAPNFRIYAIANPWVEGGYVVARSSVSERPIEADGTFRLEPLAPGVAYDIHFEQETWDMAFLNAGSQNYTPAVTAGMTLSPGQVKDIGIVDLNQGQSITGTVSGPLGERLPNITMIAVPALVDTPASVHTQTASDGSYTLWVSSFISRFFDLTAAAREDNLQESEGASLYAPKTLRVDLQSSASVDFVLAPLLGKVTGQVLTADSGALSYPFGDQKGFPAAAVFMQRSGTIPRLNPLGDIVTKTDTDGKFEIPGLSTGTYTLNAASLGYIINTTTITVTTATVSAGSLTLTRGGSVLGSIRKADPDSPTGYSCPNDQEVAGVAAADDNFTEYIPGTVEKDAVAHTVCSYEISGFKTGLDYQIALLGDSDEEIVFPYEGAVSFEALESTAAKTVNLTYRVSVPECQPTFKYLGNSQIQLTFRCNKALRNETGPDNDLEYILQKTTYTSTGANLSSSDGTGQFLGADKRLLQGRKNLTAIYRPAVGEDRFSVRLRGFTAALDPSSGNNYALDQVYDFYTAVDASKTKKFNNMQGGNLDMESEEDDENIENTKIALAPGTFVEDGETEPQPDTSVDVGVNKGKTKEQAKAKALSLGLAPGSADDRLKNLGSFPPRMASAISALRSGRVKGFEPQSSGRQSVVTPFSAFYDIFLPAGIKHELKNKARLTISYDASLSTSASLTNLNIWYFNYATQRFELENDSREIDTTNNTVSALVDHFSTFVVLASTPLYTSTSAFAGAGIEVFNFPNPFNLETKTKTLNLNAGGGSYSSGSVQVTTRGTIIRVGVPRAVSGQGKIVIYSLSGEVVREYDCGYLDGAAGPSGSGTYYYFEWDGRNGAGREVASDVYFGEMRIGGQKKFWKMAVVKDPKYR